MSDSHLSLPAPGTEGSGAFDVGSFNFHGDPVTVLTNDSGNWAVLGQLCANLTLDAEAQRQMLLRKSWSEGRTCITQVRLPGDDRSRQHFLVHERIVPMWLANVTASRITDEGKRAKIELAQLELADALYNYVTAQQPFREPSKLELARDLVGVLEAREKLEAANKILAPKAGKWDQFLNTEGLIGMREMADMFGVDARELTNWLVAKNIFRKQVSRGGGNRNLPRKMYQDQGMFTVKQESNGRVFYSVAYATAQGLDFIDDLRKKGKAA